MKSLMSLIIFMLAGTLNTFGQYQDLIVKATLDSINVKSTLS